MTSQEAQDYGSYIFHSMYFFPVLTTLSEEQQREQINSTNDDTFTIRW